MGIHIEPFPDDEFRWKVMAMVTISIVGTFIWDRLITALFAPVIFKAQLEQAADTKFADIVPIFTTLGKVAGGTLLLCSGNPLLWVGAYMMYRRYNQKDDPTKK